MVIRCVGVTLLALGLVVIAYNIFLAVYYTVRKKSGTMVPVVGTILYLVGVLSVEYLRIRWYFYLVILFDLGGLVPLMSFLFTKVLFKRESLNRKVFVERNEKMDYKINDTVSNDRNDWRFRGQDEYLDKDLKFAKYERYSETWDHDHCEFCGATFSEFEGDLHEGYCTFDKRYWICENCYNDFKSMFQWKVVDSEQQNEYYK